MTWWGCIEGDKRQMNDHRNRYFSSNHNSVSFKSKRTQVGSFMRGSPISKASWEDIFGYQGTHLVFQWVQVLLFVLECNAKECKWSMLIWESGHWNLIFLSPWLNRIIVINNDLFFFFNLNPDIQRSTRY